MNDLFNTPFETGLRAMLILSVIRSCGMTIDRLSAYDFMTIYGKDFEVSDRSSELASIDAALSARY